VPSESFRIRSSTAVQSLSVRTVSRAEEVVDTTTITTVVEGTNSKEYPASLPRKDVNYMLETLPGKSALVLFYDVNACVPYEVFEI